ncbi:DUF2461 domain-containing protein [Acrocarpospora macrocephala]|uniref:TIGR02453 family protein n=2 Tax=Acrocarpospora macrocephala TaxID=150177 RepID=A0A5M3WQM2_9ACTN|nr:TIGR02453 family protein [Acrocarpospora macrocephala]
MVLPPLDAPRAPLARAITDTVGCMVFSGIPDEAFMFYEGLEVDNSKSYWNANKQVYDTMVKAPVAAMLDELADEFGTPHLFRPYRDVRFSKDKTPYKDHQGGYIQILDGVGYYLHIGADGLYVAGGWWSQGEMTNRFRAALEDDVIGSELEKIVDGLRSDFRISGDRLKTRPRGVPEDHPRLDLLRHKSLYAARQYEPEPWVHTPEALDRVRQTWRTLTPLVDWLRVRLS